MFFGGDEIAHLARQRAPEVLNDWVLLKGLRKAPHVLAHGISPAVMGQLSPIEQQSLERYRSGVGIPASGLHRDLDLTDLRR